MNNKEKLKLFHEIEKYMIDTMKANKYYSKNEIKNHAYNILIKIINKPVETTNEQPKCQCGEYIKDKCDPSNCPLNC